MATNTTDTAAVTLEARAQARHVRVTPQKARRVIDLVRGKNASEAIATLRFAPQSASEPILKVLESAIANARVKADKMGQLQRLDASADPEEFQRLNRELMQLEMQRRSLRSDA